MGQRIVKVKYIAYHCQRTDRAAVAHFVDFNAGVLAAEYVEGRRNGHGWRRPSNTADVLVQRS